MKSGKFKQTEIGMIPEDWEVKKIEPDLGIVKSGKRLPKGYLVQDVQTNHPYIRVIDMEMGHLNTSDIKYVPNNVANLISQYKIFKDDIYISVAGTLGIVGKIPEYLDGANLTENANRITNIKCNRDFLLYYLMSDEQQKIISSSQTLGAQPKLALYQIRNFLIPLPPTLEEQTAIAKALSDVDNVISTLEKLIAKKKNIKQGAMQELLTGKVRVAQVNSEELIVNSGKLKETEIGEIPEDWEVKKIIDFTKSQTGGTPSTLNSSYWNGNIPWMNSGELNNKRIFNVVGRITEKGYENSSTHKIPKNCVLIGLAGQGKTRGTAAINYIELCTNQSIAAIFPSSQHNSEYLYQNIDNRYDELRSLSTGDGGRGGLNLSIINNLFIPLPTLEEQTAIAEILSNMDKEIDALNKKLQKYRAIKTGMMQQLLTGRIRLV